MAATLAPIADVASDNLCLIEVKSGVFHIRDARHIDGLYHEIHSDAHGSFHRDHKV